MKEARSKKSIVNKNRKDISLYHLQIKLWKHSQKFKMMFALISFTEATIGHNIILFTSLDNYLQKTLLIK